MNLRPRTVFIVVTAMWIVFGVWAIAHCKEFRVMQEFGGVTFAKYIYFDGNPVWTDAQKEERIANASTSSRTITEDDFTNIFPTQDEIDMICLSFGGRTGDSDRTISGPISMDQVKMVLTQKKYLENRIAEARGMEDSPEKTKLIRLLNSKNSELK